MYVVCYRTEMNEGEGRCDRFYLCRLESRSGILRLKDTPIWLVLTFNAITLWLHARNLNIVDFNPSRGRPNCLRMP